MSNYLLKPQKILMAMIIFSGCFTTYAQEIASASIIRSQHSFASTGYYKPLKKVLNEIEYMYNVRFNFASEIVEDKVVYSEDSYKSRSSKLTDGHLEEELKTILEPLELNYKKISDNIYGIYKVKNLPRLGNLSSSLNSVRMSSLDNALRDGIKGIEIPIKGKVTSAEGEVLPGVSVLVKGTTLGTVTDVEGNYSLSVPDGNAVLVFSYIGFTTEEVAINGRTVVNISMAQDIEQLGEVVVTALGIKKEAKKLGYATATVGSEQITENRSTNFMNALQGKMAGVNITSLGTGPAGTSKIRIRGQSSITGSNDPLVVINGVPIDNTNFSPNPNNLGMGGNGSIANRSYNNSDGGDGLTSINPDDIETMTVLKGGPAAALYGSRAKNGVIMITTKSKGSGKGISVEWNSNFVNETPLDFTDYQYEYGQGELGVRPTLPNPESGQWSFGERFQPGMTQILFDGVEVPYTPQKNHVKQFYRNGHAWTNTISLSSGGEKGGFNLSFSNLDNSSIVPNSSFNRKTVNLGFTQNFFNKLTISGNVNYSNEFNKNPPQIANQDLATSTAIYNMANSMPLWLLKEKRVDANGNERPWSRFKNRTNPYISVYERFERIVRDRVFGNLTARYNFTDWLYLQGRLGQDYFSRDQEYNYPTGVALNVGNAQPGFVDGTFTQENRRFREVNADFLIGATKTFGKFGVDINFGGNHLYRRNDLNSVVARDFTIRNLYTVMNGREKDPLYALSEQKVNSLYGAAEFSYNDLLFINVTSRNDWFSTLAPDRNSILYPSITGSFVFSQAIASPRWLNFGKIRAGYAEVGDDGSVAPYSDRLYYTVNSNLLDNRPVGSVNGGSIPNPRLRPMRISEAEVGIELKMFNNRVGLDLSYYNKITNDQILRAQVSDASGYLDQVVNMGESRNRGLEMLINLTPLKGKNFQWDLSLNGSYNETKVLKLGANPTDTMITVGRGIYEGELRQVVGKPMAQLFAYDYLYDDQGRQVFDANEGRPMRTANQMRFGSAIPKWVGGIMNTFNYKGISLSILIDFKLGHNMISATNFNAWRHGLHKGTLPGREQNYVVGDGVNPNGEVNTIQAPLQRYYETVRSQNILGQFVYNAGFWKLRQITVGYDFTKFLPSSFFVKGIRLSAVANNVAILKKWVPNIDPESFGYAMDNLNGLEATGIPTTRSMGFNLNVKF